MINSQYWAATILNEHETFANWRRSGFPQLTPVVHEFGGTNGAIPRRLPYPTIESAANDENYYEAVARLGGNDNYTSRVWWDVP